MRNYTAFLLLLTALLTLTTSTLAVEGMWTPNTVSQLPFDTLKAMGLELSPEQIFNPFGASLIDAIANVNGSSGSFVSPDGLVFTNHHVAFEAIQLQSTLEHNYLEKGFYAKTRAEEIPAIGYDVSVTLGYEDVTAKVLSSVNAKMTPLARHQAIEKATKKIIEQAEKGNDVRCGIAAFYGGKQYIMTTYFRIRDVRLVFAPPRSIGDYGGETDNWMWPRHAGDFTVLRAYVAPDGKSAEYSTANIPYKPKYFLKISLAGVKENDFTMVMGFPGTTSRYECSYGIEKMVNYDYPLDIRTRLDVIHILEAAAAKNPADAIKLSSTLKGIYNYLKKNQGMMDGFEKLALLPWKIAQEDSLKRYINSNPVLQKKYNGVFSALDSLYQDHRSWRDKEFWLNQMRRRCDFLYFATVIYKWNLEKEKKDLDREPGYQDRDTIDHKDWLRDGQTDLVPSADKEVLFYFLKKAHELPAGQKIAAVEKIFEGKSGDIDKVVQEFVDYLYANTRLGTIDDRLKMFGMKRTELESMNDAFMNFARALQVDRDNLRDRNRAFDGALNRLEPQLIAAYEEWKDGRLYPDANGTMRFNYGTVMGYQPRDAVYYEYITGLKGVIEKDTGEEPFDAPAELEMAQASQDFGPYVNRETGDVPVDFLSDNDITNGNSGSAVMNGKGELVGLAFDGNYESMTSDYKFDPRLTRTIAVDIRYVLYLLDKVYHAQELLKELTIIK
jgi:Peptidase S46